MSSVREQVIAVFADQLAMPVGVFTDETSFEDTTADSLDSVEVSMALEETFDIHIGDEEWNAVTNVGEAVALVASKMGVAA